jgi:tetratricopeptide (TPR) repeat protein
MIYLLIKQSNLFVMKRFALTLLFIGAALITFSQNSKVVSAFNYHRYGKLDQAKEAIDKAVEHEKTIGSAKAWFYRGNIYLDIANSTEEQFTGLDPDPLQKAYDSYIKAMELDDKEEYKEDIQRYLPAVAESYYNFGVVNYNLGNFREAALKFEKSFSVNQSVGNTDTTALYNAGVAATLAEDDALAKDYFKRVLKFDYTKPDIYSGLADIYKREGDTAAAVEIIKEGREIYPEDFNLLIAETNIYLSSDRQEMAMSNLEKALEIDKSNPTIFFAVGTIYDQLGDFEKAEDAYKNALALNPEYFEANYNIGALYVNKAADIQTKANDLPLDAIAEYDAEKAKADAMLQASIPYLEKSLELQPDDVNAMVSLKEIYTRLGMTEKLEAIDKKLKDQ